MVFSAPDALSTVLFVALCGVVIALFLAGVWRSASVVDASTAGRKTLFAAVGLLVWLSLLATVMPRFAAAQPMPRLPLGFGAIILVSIAVGFSPLGRALASNLPLVALVAFQGFRLPLELILHRWAKEGAIPETMTWTGQNWDIATGVVALVVAVFAPRSRVAAWIANVVGIVLLINVGRVAMMSSPLPFAWPVKPPLLLAFHLPYALIVPTCVGGAAFGHVVLTRALCRQRVDAPSKPLATNASTRSSPDRG